MEEVFDIKDTAVLVLKRVGHVVSVFAGNPVPP